MSQDTPTPVEELASASRLKSEFIANVSHELRTPVHAIIGYTELLQDGIYGQLGEEQDQTIQYIQDTAKDLLSLINNLLDVSRIESGRVDLMLTSFDLRDLVAEVFNQLRPLAETKHLALQAQVTAAGAGIHTDRGKLKQILVNLVGNAIKFTNSGSVTVAVAPAATGAPSALTSQRPHLLLTVKDTGIGIAADKLDRIFEKFYQVDGSVSRPQEGTGLGLYLTRHLVDLLTATIRVESAPGQGTTATVCLPVNYEEVEAIRRLRKCIASSVTVPEQPADQRRLVLAVSENPDIAQMLVAALGSAEFTVRVAATAQEATALAQKLRPLVVLLDAESASLGCWQVFQELKTNPTTKDIPTILVGNDGATSLRAPISVAAPLNRQDVIRSIRAATATSHKKLLVVDDDPGFREVLKCALSEEGYQVEEAVDGQQALAKLNDGNPPDLLLLDLRLPDVDGWAVMQHIAQEPRLKNVQVIVLTGIVLDDKERAALETQADGFIRKGEFRVATVLETVANALEVK